jgi:hypothetical protein
MSNHRDPETLLIRRQEEESARSRRPPQRHWPSSPRMPSNRQSQPAAISGRLQGGLPSPGLDREKAPLLPRLKRTAGDTLRLPGTLTIARLKVSTALNAAELLAVPVPVGKPRVTLRINLPGRFVTAEIAAKSLRKAQRAIRETGADNIALVLQGRLSGDTIAEAGLSAQPKVPKAASP